MFDRATRFNQVLQATIRHRIMIYLIITMFRSSLTTSQCVDVPPTEGASMYVLHTTSWQRSALCCWQIV